MRSSRKRSSSPALQNELRQRVSLRKLAIISNLMIPRYTNFSCLLFLGDNKGRNFFNGAGYLEYLCMMECRSRSLILEECAQMCQNKGETTNWSAICIPDTWGITGQRFSCLESCYVITYKVYDSECCKVYELQKKPDAAWRISGKTF